MPRPQVTADPKPSDGAAPKADKRALILDAAIRVFAEHGFYGARVSDIATEAGIAYGLVYHYFKNKDEILATIFEERWSHFVEIVEDIASSPGTPRDRLVSIAALILNVYRVRPDWVKVLVLEIQRSSRFAHPGQLRAVGRLLEAVTRILRDGQAEGLLRRELDPGLACRMFIGALDLEVTSLVLGVVQLPEGAEERRAFFLKAAHTYVEIFLHGFARGGQHA